MSPAKFLMAEQCDWLHQKFPPPTCCICNAREEITRLSQSVERLERMVADAAKAITYLSKLRNGEAVGPSAPEGDAQPGDEP